ncbi:MAG: Mur ligase family protein [Pirellulales bacterium]|jgi:UDP-N-acetylmuramoylalanine--D-glutamate ligase|nr:Mur ligase family protein [Thermoguttaceae bacterium]MDD4786155.1 Mur ligase family protein [Pirellulales bacterium]MDI9445995.1 Mur ligase family protein [Planctomycetota bacterium]NLZ01053.1 hypothetical protein [Pirellulaceae bacterium]
MEYAGLRATVMGLGHFGGGLAAAKWLARAGALVTVTDLAPEDRLGPSLAALRREPIRRCVLGRHRQEDFRATDLVVVNPAVRPGSPWLEIARRAGARLTSEMQLFLETCRARLVGVTGTNGKSTTAAMIAAALGAAGRRVLLGGNIGRSLLEDAASLGPDDYAVVELSSFQLFWLGAGVPMPPTAVITNFSPNHLDWHATLEEYAAAKQRLLLEQTASDTAVFDPSAPGLSGWAPLVRGRLIAPRPASDNAPLRLCGRHNRVNAALAAAAARGLGCPEQAIETGLAGFSGLGDRLEPVATIGERTFYNDSASTTPESTIAALRALPPPVWLLAGGVDKGLDYRALVEEITQRAAGAVFFGRAARRLADLVKQRAAWMPCRAAANLREAMEICLAQSLPASTIVLSPACSSHDQFTNYRQRAAAFVELVQSLAARAPRADREPQGDPG